MLENIAYKVLNKSNFPKVKSVDHELRKSSLLRILLGIIIFTRFYQITDYYNLYHGDYLGISLITLGLIVLFIIGFSLPIVTLLLIVFVRYCDGLTSTGTLGTSILMQVLFVLLLMNSGEYYSIDGRLLKKKNIISRAIRFQYSIIGKHNANSLRFVYFFAFFVYALISFGAILAHFQDYFWTNGLTVKSLLSNSYLSLYFEEFRWFESNFPIVTSVFSMASGVFQSIFQALMIILIFFKTGSFFVKWWGILFFVISLFVINLSYLPHIELILWLLIFFPIPIAFKIYGIKNISGATSQNENKILEIKQLNKGLLKIYFLSYSLALLLLIFTWFPYVSKYTPDVFGNKNRYIRGLLFKSGLEIPYVFNYVDLSMGDIWMVVYRKKADSLKWNLVPITGEDGARLTYNGINLLGFSNHNSDFLYFGTSLEYRRTIINAKDYNEFHDKGFGFKSFVKRVKFDYRNENLKGDYFYKLIVYKNNSSKAVHWKGKTSRHDKKVIYTNVYMYNGETFKNISK